MIDVEVVTSNQKRNIPHNIDAEKSILSAMSLTLDACSTGIQKLTPESFYKIEHREIFIALMALFEENLPGDLITLVEKLSRLGKLESAGGPEYVSHIVNYVPSTAHLEHHISIVSEKAVLRSLINTTTAIIDDCFKSTSEISELVDLAEKKIFEIAQKKVQRDFICISELIKSGFEKAEQMMNSHDVLTGIETGFIDLDKKTNGLQPSDMIVLAARPSMGKTALALNIAEHAAVKTKKSVGIFSLEMSKEQLVFRLLCSNARVSAQRLRSGFASPADFEELKFAAGRLSESPIYIDDTPGISIMELRGKARRLKARTDCQLIVIDYLQLITSPSGKEGRQQEISDISRSVKEIARELNIPVIILSQLNRLVEQRKDHKPMLSDLRESGAIEQDADVVLMLYRKEYYDPSDDPGTADLCIAKQRNGPTGDIRLQWSNEYTRFGDLETRE